jgi:hypothetical protein
VRRRPLEIIYQMCVRKRGLKWELLMKCGCFRLFRCEFRGGTHKRQCFRKISRVLTKRYAWTCLPSPTIDFLSPGPRQLLVSCGGGRRLVDGLRQQHVHTIRPLMWDTLEEFSPLGLHTWDEDSTLHARTWTKDESVQNDG